MSWKTHTIFAIMTIILIGLGYGIAIGFENREEKAKELYKKCYKQCSVEDKIEIYELCSAVHINESTTRKICKDLQNKLLNY